MHHILIKVIYRNGERVVKIAFVLILVMICVAMIVNAVYISKKEGSVAAYCRNFLYAGAFSIILYSIFLMCNELVMATFFYGLFICMLEWLLLYFFRYTLVYTCLFTNNKLLKKTEMLFNILTVLSNTSIILNNVLHHMFRLDTVVYTECGEYWYVTGFTVFYYIHLIYCYGLVVLIMLVLLYKILKTASSYRNRYTSILASFCMLIVSDAFCLFLAYPVNVSLVFYGIIAMFLSYFSLYHVPNIVIAKILSLSIQDMSSAMICFDENKECIYYNNNAKDVFKLQDKGHIDYAFAKWFKKHKDDIKVDNIWHSKEIRENGETLYFDMEYHNMKDEKGRQIGYYFILNDTTDSTLAYIKECYNARHDNLTGLYNRDYFFKKTAKMLKNNPNTTYYMLCSDIKDFKLVNNLFGFESGNEVLIAEADILRQRLGKNVTYGRLSADRFAICMPKSKYREEDFTDCIKELRTKYTSDVYRMHIYMGVYEITDINEEISSMIDKATLAISSIWGDYDKIVAYFGEELMEKTLLWERMCGEFDNALANNEFKMYLQPQFDTSGTLKGSEALVRWIHPEHGIIPPISFIEAFENAGLIYQLDQYMWEEAAKTLAKWKAIGKEDYCISVNISTKDFYYCDIYSIFINLIQKYDINPHNLKIEITESVFMNDVDKSIEILDKLKNKGFEIEIDDFGSGFSSLNMLKDIHADVVKIDMGFLKETENGERSRIILANTINLIKELGMHSITEGVENKSQVDMLTKMGCDMFQGYYYSKPISVKEFESKYF